LSSTGHYEGWSLHVRKAHHIAIKSPAGADGKHAFYIQYTSTVTLVASDTIKQILNERARIILLCVYAAGLAPLL
jgi:hypothetical protein